MGLPFPDILADVVRQRVHESGEVGWREPEIPQWSGGFDGSPRRTIAESLLNELHDTPVGEPVVNISARHSALGPRYTVLLTANGTRPAESVSARYVLSDYT